MPGKFFLPCDEKREIKTFCDNITRMIEAKQLEKMLDGLIKWLNIEQVTDALKVARDQDAWF